MHDGHHVNPRADRQYTVDTVRLLVPAMRAKGFEFAPMCEPAAIAASDEREADGSRESGEHP